MGVLRAFQDVEFGGTDSRSNPLNEPRNRALRCLNWVPKEAGYLELRWGYSTITMSATSASGVQTVIPYTLWNGSQYVIFQQGTTWKQMDANGTVTTPTVKGAAFASSSRSQSYAYNNHLHVGNGTDQKWYDGTNWRNNGIRAATTTDNASVTVTQGAGDANGLAATSVGGSQPGYQFYVAIYNPNTGHVGNRISIGARLANNTACDVSIANLPTLSEDSEYSWVFGRTRDGGSVPYVVTDASGNWIHANNGSTSYTITSGAIDGNFELPTRNGVIPSQCSLFAVVGDYIWAADTASATIRRSGSQLDANQGIFMGLPEQSWASNDIQTFPTAQATTAIFEVDLELLVGTKNDCAILTDMAGVPMWRGPWPVGIAGPRAGVKTHHGFFFLSPDKELCTFVNGLPVPISEEYELAELSQLGDAYMGTVELIYFRDKTRGKDEIRIEGQKSDGTPHTIIHDFRLRDEESPYGQGYGSEFLGALGTVFTSATVRDGNGKLQAYSASSTGQFYELYSGANDVGNEFTADYIMLVNGGLNRVSVPSLDWHGDANLTVSVGRQLKTSTNSAGEFTFQQCPTEGYPGYEDSYLFRAKLTTPETLHSFLRLQLTSHSADGDLTLNDPPHCPLENYGRVYDLIPALGNERGR